MASRKDILNKEEILSKVNPLEIYQREIDLKQKGNNWVGLCVFHKEKTPSLNIYPEGNYYCYGCESGGDIIGFIMKRYGLSYIDALKKLKEDASLTPILSKKVIKREKQPIVVEWMDMKFSKKHHDYFNQYELSEDFLTKEMDIYAVKIYKIGNKTFKIPENRIVFAYFAPDLGDDGEIKLLTIGKDVPKEEKWRSYNIPNAYLWYYYKYKDTCCNDLFVCKSNKDSSVLKKLGYCTISVQSEGSKVLLENNVDRINSIGKRVFMVYGSDNQGFIQSKKVTDSTGWSWLNTQKYLLKWGINDPAEYVKEFSSDTLDKELKKQLKNKNGSK